MSKSFPIFLFSIFLMASSCTSSSDQTTITKEDQNFLLETRSDKGTNIGGKAGYPITRVKRINKINRAKAMRAMRRFCNPSQFSILIEEVKDYERKFQQISQNINNGKLNIIIFQCH